MFEFFFKSTHGVASQLKLLFCLFHSLMAILCDFLLLCSRIFFLITLSICVKLHQIQIEIHENEIIKGKTNGVNFIIIYQ